MDDLQYWQAIDGQVNVSTERFKHGISSLKWEWSSSSTLTYTNPALFHSLKAANNKCFALWLFSCQQPNSEQQPFYVEFFGEKTDQPIERIWFHVNFYGWRPLGIRYALLSSLKNNLSRVHSVRFCPPSNIDAGVYYLNAPNFDYTHPIGPKADYQQPWASPERIARLKDDPTRWLFTPMNIAHNRPWLDEQQIVVSNSDVDKLKDRWLKNLPYATWSPSTKPESFDKLEPLAAKYGIQSDAISNLPLGKGGFYAPANAQDIQPFLLGPLKRTATTFQCHQHNGTAQSDEGQRIWTLLIQLCDYLLEQGWCEGNGNLEGHLDIGYEIRNFPMCLVYIRDQLQQVGRLEPMLTSAMWIMYGHLLVEQQPSSMSTDIIHNYLTNVSRLIVCIPDPNELVRRIIAFRFMFEYALDNLIHEPLALDGTVHHHWMCHFEYTAYTLPDILKLVSNMNDTQFHFSDNLRRILRRCVYTLNFCLIENDKIPPNLNARAGKFVSCNGINMAKTCVCICDEDHSYDPFIAGILVGLCAKNDKSIAGYLHDGIDPISFDGHLTLNSTAACIHRRSNFYAAIVGMGKNRRGLEIYGWLSDSNNYGEYVRNCSIFLVPSDENGSVKYINAGCAFPGWDWSHWPGTTCLIKPRAELFEGYCNLTAKNWLAGGTSLAKQDGMFSNDFFVWDIAFRRSIYCFDHRLTVLTTNIKLLQQKKRPVVTTLFQSNFANLIHHEQTPFIIDNETIDEFPFEKIYDQGILQTIIDHRQIVYYLHPHDNSDQFYRLTLRRSEQEMIYCNQYYLIDTKQNPIVDMKSKKFKETKFEDNEKFFKTTKDTFGLGFVEHLQVDDGSASFVYTIVMPSDSSQTHLNQWTEEFARLSRDPWSSEPGDLPPSLILSKGDDTHIFYDRDTDTTCYTCYSNVRLQVETGLVRSFGQPCMAMVRGRGPGTITASIATTDFMRNETLTLVLKGKWIDAELLSDNENNSVHVRSEVLNDGDTKITVWQRLYMPVEFHITQASE